MSIKILLSSGLYQHTEMQNTISVEGKNVEQCIRELITLFPGIKAALFDTKDKLLDYVGIYLNKENISHLELKTPVQDGDVLHIVPMIFGG